MINPTNYIKGDNKIRHIGMGDNGDYICVLCAGDQTAYIIDTTKCTTGNYLGAGAWTNNPVAASPSLPTGDNYIAVVYRYKDKKWWFVGNARLASIDADPSSGSFGTVVDDITVSGIPSGSNLYGAYYDPYNDRIGVSGVFSGISTIAYYDFKSSTFVSSPSLGIKLFGTGVTSNTNIAHNIRFHHLLQAFSIADLSLGSQSIFRHDIFDNPNKKDRYIRTQYLSSGVYVLCANNQSRIFIEANNQVNVYAPDFRFVATISLTNLRNCAPDYSEKHSEFVCGGSIINDVYFIGNDLTASSAIAKTSPETNETGTKCIECSDDVALVMPHSITNTTTNFTRVHAYNISGNSYVGYVNVGSIGDHNTFSYKSNMMAKNRSKI